MHAPDHHLLLPRVERVQRVGHEEAQRVHQRSVHVCVRGSSGTHIHHTGLSELTASSATGPWPTCSRIGQRGEALHAINTIARVQSGARGFRNNKMEQRAQPSEQDSDFSGCRGGE